MTRFTSILALLLLAMSAFGLYAKAVSSDEARRQALAAVESGDPAGAVAIWRPLAEAGDRDATYHLGRAYMYGQGVALDYDRARDLLGKAAAEGHPAAQKEYGKLFDRGWGVAQDLDEARRWYQASADQGYAEAQHNLGAMAYYGLGQERDPTQARVWYGRAAEQGLAVSQFSLSALLLAGEGGGRDPHEAVRWLEKAVEADYAPAMVNLADLLIKGDGVVEDRSRASTLLAAAAALGQPQARFRLGVIALGEGNASKADPVEALKWFTLAADLGHGEADAAAKRLSRGLSSAEREQARARIATYRAENPLP